jgi:hypothetical protein
MQPSQVFERMHLLMKLDMYDFSPFLYRCFSFEDANCSGKLAELLNDYRHNLV